MLVNMLQLRLCWSLCRDCSWCCQTVCTSTITYCWRDPELFIGLSFNHLSCYHVS